MDLLTGLSIKTLNLKVSMKITWKEKWTFYVLFFSNYNLSMHQVELRPTYLIHPQKTFYTFQTLTWAVSQLLQYLFIILSAL